MKLATVTRSFAKGALTALLAVACQSEAIEQTQAPSHSEPVVSSYVPTATLELDDALVARIEEGETKAGGRESLLRELGVRSLRRVFPDAGEYEARSRAMGLHRFYSVEFSSDEPVTKAVSSLENIPGVLSVEQDHLTGLRAFFNDPYLFRQWNMVNSDYPEADIHVQQVWERYTVGAPSVIVSVVDEPVDPTNTDISFWTDAEGHTGYNFARDNWDLSVRPVYDRKGKNIGDFGHGTHVAGILSAINNNGRGVAGMAGGNAAAGIPGARVMSCVIYSGELEARNDMQAAAIKWGADHGALISQNSWGYVADGCIDGTKDGKVTPEEMAYYKSMTIPRVMRKAIDYFITYAGCDAKGNQRADSPMKGGLVIFSAGNEGDMGVDYDPICDYEPVISVGAVDHTGKPAVYSQYGDWVDIAAPGGSLDATDPGVLSLSPYFEPKGVMELVGTSQAAPHVSGAAALLISYFGGPGFTADLCKAYLLGGAGPVIGGDKPVGRMLNVLGSFLYGEEKPLQLEREEVTLKAHETVTLGYVMSGADAVGHTAGFTPPSPALTVDTERLTLTVSGRKTEAGTYDTVFWVKTASGDVHEVPFRFTILPNHAPQKLREMENQWLQGLQRAANVNLDAYFTDEDGEVLTYEAVSDVPDYVKTAISGGTLTVYAAGYGISRVGVTATDALGKSASASFRVAVSNAQVPVSVTPSVVSADAQIVISSENETDVNLRLYSPAGARLFEGQYRASVFSPIHLDVSKLAPGRYTLQVAYGGQEYKVALVKY